MLMGIATYAQNTYPLNYFTNPLSIPILLAGNFGECRANHFHSGIDIKTLGKENMQLVLVMLFILRIPTDLQPFMHI